MPPIRSVALAAMLFSAKPASGQHLNAGAVGHNQNDAAVWANGAAFAVESGFVQNMALATSGRYAGLYNSGPTLTALSATNGGAAFGSFLMAEIVSVAGPTGSIFSFWEGADQGGGATPLFSVAAGSTGLSHQFALSDVLEGAGTPGGDPFGHLHGRRFTATDLGTYTVGFRVVDTSVNGVSGGAIHLPSGVLYMNFAAVPEPSSLAVVALGLAGSWVLRRKRNNRQP